MTERILLLKRARVPVHRGALAGAAATLFALTLWLALSLSAGGSSHVPAARAATPLTTLASLPFAAQGPASAALGAAAPAYRVLPTAGTLQANSPAQRLHASFAGSGMVLSSGSAHVGLTLRELGYGSALAPVAAATPSATGNRVVYAHPGLSEWYANGPLGVEQGFTVARPASTGSEGALTLAMTVSGNLRASLARGGARLVFSEGGRRVIRYGGLLATDANGRALPSWLELRPGSVLLRVDARGASYPLHIDPLVAGESLSGQEEEKGGYFGRNVAMTPDGTTAVIGGTRDGINGGSAWVFTRTGATWTQQGPKLTAGAEEGHQGRFGASVAISNDGNTIVVGANTDSVGVGAAWVFTRSEGVWTQQGPKLTGGEEAGKGYFGESVALSADGNTALIGGNQDESEAGAAWVFVRVGGTWAQSGAKLTGAGETGAGQFGQSLALSADGSTAMIGAPTDATGLGAVWTFTRSGGIFTQQGEKLTGGDEVGEGQFGQSVAFSGDANTAIIGGYRDGASGRGGAAWIFNRSGAAWVQDGAKLTGGPGSFFGYSVAMSASGEVALVGGPRDHGKQGAVWEYIHAGGEWVSAGSRILGIESPGESGELPEEIEEGAFGRSVAISADGTQALVGAPRDVELTGAVWVLVQPTPIVATAAATAVHQTTATLHGFVNPHGRAITECRFEYGTVGYEASVPCSANPALGSKIVPVEAPLTGLTPNTVYRARIVAANIAGASTGSEITFTTPAVGGSSGPPVETPAGKGGVSAFIESSGGSGTTSSGAACAVVLASRSATVPGGKRVAVKLRANGAFAGACKGRLRLTVRVHAKGAHAKSRTIGVGSFSLAVGRTRWVRVALNSYGRKLLAGNTAKVSALLSIVKIAPGPTQARNATVRIPAHARVAVPRRP